MFVVLTMHVLSVSLYVTTITIMVTIIVLWPLPNIFVHSHNIPLLFSVCADVGIPVRWISSLCELGVWIFCLVWSFPGSHLCPSYPICCQLYLCQETQGNIIYVSNYHNKKKFCWWIWLYTDFIVNAQVCTLKCACMHYIQGSYYMHVQKSLLDFLPAAITGEVVK